MKEPFPFVETTDGIILVRFVASDTMKSVDVKCVVDYTDFGEVVGIEILDWCRQLSGGQIDGPSGSGTITWSYDDEIDALYIRTTAGRGQNQQRTTATVGLDADQRVTTVQVASPSPIVRTS